MKPTKHSRQKAFLLCWLMIETTGPTQGMRFKIVRLCKYLTTGGNFHVSMLPVIWPTTIMHAHAVVSRFLFEWALLNYKATFSMHLNFVLNLQTHHLSTWCTIKRKHSCMILKNDNLGHPLEHGPFTSGNSEKCSGQKHYTHNGRIRSCDIDVPTMCMCVYGQAMLDFYLNSTFYAIEIFKGLKVDGIQNVMKNSQCQEYKFWSAILVVFCIERSFWHCNKEHPFWTVRARLSTQWYFALARFLRRYCERYYSPEIKCSFT